MSKSPLLSHLSEHKACSNPVIGVVTLQGAAPWSSGTWFELTAPATRQWGRPWNSSWILQNYCARGESHTCHLRAVFTFSASRTVILVRGGLGSDAVWSGRSLPTFQAKLLPPFSGLMIKTAGFSDMSVWLYQNARCHISPVLAVNVSNLIY